MVLARPLRIIVLLVAALFGAALWIGLRNASADPIVRRATIVLPGLEQASPPLRIVLLSDLHVSGPDNSPQRIARLVDQVNLLRPDLVLIAGDILSSTKLGSHKYSANDALAPLTGLTPRLKTLAVLGNHDHWVDAAAVRAALARAGVRELRNSAVRVGPVTIAGIDDDFTGNDDLAAMIASAEQAGAPVIQLSHSPDVTPRLPEAITLVLAGHTHCGQIRLPVVGRLSTQSNYGERYACGLIREGNRTIIVSAGIGTSLLPLRYGVPPDLWLLEIVPSRSYP